jgi:hypothetical protein
VGKAVKVAPLKPAVVDDKIAVTPGDIGCLTTPSDNSGAENTNFAELASTLNADTDLKQFETKSHSAEHQPIEGEMIDVETSPVTRRGSPGCYESLVADLTLEDNIKHKMTEQKKIASSDVGVTEDMNATIEMIMYVSPVGIIAHKSDDTLVQTTAVATPTKSDSAPSKPRHNRSFSECYWVKSKWSEHDPEEQRAMDAFNLDCSIDATILVMRADDIAATY